MFKYMRGSTVAVLSLCTMAVAAQELTIPEAVRRMGSAPYVTGRIRELAPMAFDQVAREADLIVHATLRKQSTYLSEDQKTLYTDFEIVPTAVITSRYPTTLSRPGVVQGPVLRQWGGETTINGVSVRIYDENFPLLQSDRQFLLLLTFNKSLGKYEIVDGIAGAFEIDTRNKLKHLVQPRVAHYERFNGADLAEVVREIHRHRR